MKIAIVSPGFLPVPAIKGGAVESLITEIIKKNEIEKKYRIDLYTITSDYNFEFICTDIIEINTSKTIEYFEKIINKLFQIFKIKKMFRNYDNKVSKILSKNRYDYILIENNMYLYEKIFRRYPFETKYLFHLHNDILGIDKPKKLCELIANTSNKIITVSEYIKERFAGVTKSYKKVNVLLNSIDLKKFEKNIRIENKKNHYRTFLFVGRFSKEKGLLELVNAYINFSKNNKNSRLIIAGDYSENNKYTREILNLVNKKSDIKMLGYISNENMPDIYSICDVVVVPSICEEAFGITALEALSMGKPVIVTRSGGLIEIVKEDFGIIIDKTNIIYNLEKALDLMCDNEIYDNFVENIKSNSEYLLQFDIKTYFDRFNDIVKGE